MRKFDKFIIMTVFTIMACLSIYAGVKYKLPGDLYWLNLILPIISIGGFISIGLLKPKEY